MVGMLVGKKLGEEEGVPVGTPEGQFVAPGKVGGRVESGDSVGCFDVDGDAVGINVGRADGLIVGVFVGFADG